uniref:Gelsolin-like domain-containing protein n=1 Tax=Callorhinchus milii TaxID=7868 RepID=A0A4W3GZS1_CALMI
RSGEGTRLASQRGPGFDSWSQGETLGKFPYSKQIPTRTRTICCPPQPLILSNPSLSLFLSLSLCAVPFPAAKVEKKKFDVTLLYAEPELAAHQRMVDDGSGKLEIWRIEDLELEPVDPKTYGHFYGGDCYLVLYTYMKGHKPAYIIYFWQVCGLPSTAPQPPTQP